MMSRRSVFLLPLGLAVVALLAACAAPAPPAAVPADTPAAAAASAASPAPAAEAATDGGFDRTDDGLFVRGRATAPVIIYDYSDFL